MSKTELAIICGLYIIIMFAIGGFV